MLKITNLSMQFGGRILFKNVNLNFQKGNCYGIIGANGAGKSTLLRIISGELEPTDGHIEFTEHERLSILKQNQNAYDDFTAIQTVIQGYPKLIEIENARNALYMKEDFSEEDGIKAAELEAEYAEMGGYEADSDARSLLSNLGIPSDKHDTLMGELDA